nr:PREDICTED: uncharacterized protein LOC109033764 [Bemisia tabaci]
MDAPKIFNIFMILLAANVKFPRTVGQNLQISQAEHAEQKFRVKRQLPNQYNFNSNSTQNQLPNLNRVYFSNIPIESAVAEMKQRIPSRYFAYTNFTQNQSLDRNGFTENLPMDGMKQPSPNRFQSPDPVSRDSPIDSAVAQMNQQIANPYIFYPNATFNQFPDLGGEYFTNSPMDGAVSQDFPIFQPEKPGAGNVKDTVTDNRSTIFNVLILSNYLSLSPFRDDLGDSGLDGRAVSKFNFSGDVKDSAGPRLVPRVRNSTIVFLDGARLPSYTGNVTGRNREESRKKFSFEDVNLDMRNLKDLVDFRRKPVPLELSRGGGLPRDVDDSSRVKATMDLPAGSHDGPALDPGRYPEITQFHGDNSSLIMIRLDKDRDKRPRFGGGFDQSGMRGRGTFPPRKFRKEKGYSLPGRRESDEERNITEDFREMEMHLAQISKLMARIEKKKKQAVSNRSI